MLKKSLYFVSICMAAALNFGCDSSFAPSNHKEFGTTENAIINGTETTGNEFSYIVALTSSYSGKIGCSGTLITPEWIMTAGHCLGTDTPQPDGFSIVFGNDIRNPVYKAKVDNYFVHPKFTSLDVSPYTGVDMGLMHLAEPVPENIAKPLPPLPPELALTATDIDTASPSLTGIECGFGMTRERSPLDPNGVDQENAGTKHYKTVDLIGFCPRQESLGSSRCTLLETYEELFREFVDYYKIRILGFILTDETDGGIAPCDSGSALIVNVNGTDYAAGIATLGLPVSEVDNLKKIDPDTVPFGGYTIVTDLFDFIRDHIPELDKCYVGLNEDGTVRYNCSSSDCSSNIHCQPENCDNLIDDNDNGKTDCEDLECSSLLRCQPEDCTNGKDDNGNGKIDCDDSMCASYIACKPEICNNGKDDNGDGKIDCEDPQCSDKSVCKAEDCTNGIDDNGNGLIDCAELSCVNSPACKIENCSNRIDDNGDGKIDCDDPKCSEAPICQKEICDDNVDNDGDGAIDCNDSDCADLCGSDDSDHSGCSALPLNSAAPHIACWLMALLGFAAIRRRKENR